MKHAFTLVELLVVVAIIVILIAIMIPALEKAITRAERTHCLANLHGIGSAIATFTQDKKDKFPQHDQWNTLLGSQATNNYYSNAGQSTANRPLNAYLGYAGDNAVVKIAECPSDLGDVAQGPMPNAYIAYGTSYLGAWGGNYYRTTAVFGAGASSGEPVNSLRMTQIKPTASKLVVGDWMWHANRQWSSPMSRWHDEPVDGEDPLTAGALRKQNILFADTHAEFFNKITAGEIDNVFGADPYRGGVPGWKWW